MSVWNKCVDVFVKPIRVKRGEKRDAGEKHQIAFGSVRWNKKTPFQICESHLIKKVFWNVGSKNI